MYPPTPRGSDSTVYRSEVHGNVRVADPYRWLEQDSPQTQTWALAQDLFSAAHLRRYDQLEALTTIVKRAHDYTQFEVPFPAQDNRWYWMARSGAQKQPALYRTTSTKFPSAGEDGLDDLEAISELFFNTDILSTNRSLTTWAFSPNATLAAYSISTFGSDADEIMICRPNNILTKECLASHCIESLKCIGYGVFAWAADSKGLYYTQPVSLKLGSLVQPKLWWHKVGSCQEDDEVFLLGEPGSIFFISLSFDQSYILLDISRDTTGANKLWVAKNSVPVNGVGLEWVKIKDNFQGTLQYVGNHGPLFTFMTNVASDRYSVVQWAFQKDNKSVFIPVNTVPHSRDFFLRQYLPINDAYAVAVYSHNVNDELYLIPTNGKVERLDPDFVGSISVTPIGSGFLASFINGKTPKLVKKVDLTSTEEKSSWKIWRDTRFEAFALDDFFIKQLWFRSKDGTSIPMFILYHKFTKLDGTAPCLQYGYGGVVPLIPFFSPMFLTFVHEFGGVVALPNIRGGSEFGRKWSDGGSRAHRSNSIDDFLSATEYLIKQRYISSVKITILGWSTGAELVAQSIARAPGGTFGCAIGDRGAYDLLRFPLFHPGVYWYKIAGDPLIPQEFDFMYPLSSLHNVPSNKMLPPTLLITGGEDVRIASLHGYKFLAACQHHAACGSGIQILKSIKGAGHEIGKSIDIKIEEVVLVLGFLAQSLHLKLLSTDMGVVEKT